MDTVHRVKIESLPLEERIKIATRGLSITAYANGNYTPVSAERAKELDRIARKSMSEFNLQHRRKIQAA